MDGARVIGYVRNMRPAVALLLTLATLGAPHRVLASPRPAVEAQDVVRLKNGGFLRGAIAELVPGQHVVIVLVSGETRRVPMSEVTYAGPEEAGGGGPPRGRGERAPRGTEGVRLTLRATRPDLTYHLLEGQSVGRVESRFGSDGEVRSELFRILCKAPCEVSIEPGSHRFALAVGDEAPVAATSLRIRGEATLEASYRSYELVRILGWVVGTGGVVAGSAVLFDPLVNRPANQDLDKGPVILGLGIILGGAIVGGILGAIEDDAEIRVVP